MRSIETGVFAALKRVINLSDDHKVTLIGLSVRGVSGLTCELCLSVRAARAFDPPRNLHHEARGEASALAPALRHLRDSRTLVSVHRPPTRKRRKLRSTLGSYILTEYTELGELFQYVQHNLVLPHYVHRFFCQLISAVSFFSLSCTRSVSASQRSPGFESSHPPC